MGKSTTASMFADAGVPTWDADAVVSALYEKGGEAVSGIKKICPGAAMDGTVDRAALKNWIADDPKALAQIEAVVHPLVAENRAQFIANTDAPVVLLDVPLLFESGTADMVDVVVVVSAPEEVQRSRILDRGTMTTEEVDAILERQMPDAKKRERADYVIQTDSLDSTRAAVQDVLADIRRKHRNA